MESVMFESHFAESHTNRVRMGNSIRCVVNGIEYKATLEEDMHTPAPDKNQDGFWPSKNPQDAGYIGENPSISFEDQMADYRAVMSA